MKIRFIGLMTTSVPTNANLIKPGLPPYEEQLARTTTERSQS
jgi:hypothetical protein